MNSNRHDDHGANTDSPLLCSTAELSAGDWISATYRGVLVHQGQVTEIAPNQELFWIMDTVTGSRRLLDLIEFGVTPIERPQHPTSQPHAA